jgi:hypothetical protein
MFKVDHLFGRTGSRPSISGNGSVPSIGGTSLADALAGVERAEQALAAARALARAAAKREGQSVRGLFEDSRFILRASGERWCDTARSEGERAGLTMMADHLSRAYGADPAAERAEVKTQLEREAPARAAAGSARRKLMRDSGFLRALSDGDHDTAVEIYRRITPGPSTADQIIRAAKTARMGGPEVPPPEKGTLAEKIILAGQRRRGEI